MKATISDVAKLAGVSIATVSYVLNDAKDIPAATRERVLSAAKSLDYIPNSSAKSLKTGKKNLIGFIASNLSKFYFATQIEGIESAISTSGYRLLVANAKESVENEIDIYRSFSSGLVDGLLVATSASDFQEIADSVPKNIPTIYVGTPIKNCHHNSVSLSSYNAVCEAVTYLTAKGHKRIGYIANYSHRQMQDDRLDAFRLTLIKNGLPFIPEDDVVFTNDLQGVINDDVDRILSTCTAVVAANHTITRELVTYCIYKGIMPKRDIEIVGFKYTSSSNRFYDSISLVNQPAAEMGIFASQELIKMIESGRYSDQTLEKTFYGTFIPAEAVR